MKREKVPKRIVDKSKEILVDCGLMYNKSQMFGDEAIAKMCGGLRKKYYDRADEYGERCWKASGKKFDLIVHDCGNSWYQLVKKVKRC